MLQGHQSIIDFEVHTKSIKGALNPLANQVAIMSSYNSKKKGVKSKKVLTLARHINTICFELVRIAREVAKEHPDVEYELNQACNRTLDVYNSMKNKIEGDDKRDSATTIIDIAKQLINHVAVILIVTDSADLNLIDNTVKQVEQCLKEVEQCTDICIFDGIFQKLQNTMDVLMKQIANRQIDLLDTQRKEDLASVRAMWMRCKERLYTTSRIVIVHPELETGVSNQSEVVKEIADSMKKLQLTIKGKSTDSQSKAGILASTFEMFELNVVFAAKMSRDQQEALQDQLSLIIHESTTIAGSERTREERRQNIHRLCKECDMSLHILIHSNMETDNDEIIEKICETTGELKHYLKLATLDHIDDYFFLPHIPFQVLFNIATDGARDKDQYRESEQEMVRHVYNLQGIARMACSLSVESYHNKVVRTAIARTSSLLKQVIYATRSLANQKKSEYIIKNMDVYKRAWTKELILLIEAVDEISPVDEFLYISLWHAKEDVEQIEIILNTESFSQNENNCKERNWADLDQTVDALTSRSYRVLNVVKEERRKVVDERYLLTDPVMVRLQYVMRYTLTDTKKLCNDIVKNGKNKNNELKKQVTEVVNQLSRIQIEFSKTSMRCEAYVESFKAECHSTLHELTKNSTTPANDKILRTCLEICTVLKIIVANIDHENCMQLWIVTIQKLKDLNTAACQLDFNVREITTNCRTSAIKNDVTLRDNIEKIIGSSRHALNMARRDMSLYVCYGEIFVAILSSSKTIISCLPLIYKGCFTSHGKRRKGIKK